MHDRALPDTIDWASFSADGPAEDVPSMLRLLQSEDGRVREAAYLGLVRQFFHQGTVHEVAVLSAPFLIDLVADSKALCRVEAYKLLSLMVGESFAGDEERVRQVRQWLANRESVSVAQLQRQLREWVVVALRDGVRPGGPWRGDLPPEDYEAAIARWGLQAYEAARAGLRVYIAALDDPDPLVSTYAVRMLILFAEDRASVVPTLLRTVALGRDESVLAAVLLAIRFCFLDYRDEVEPQVVDVVTSRLNHQSRLVEWAAAIATATLVNPPPAGLIGRLYECVLEAHPIPDWPEIFQDIAYLASTALSEMSIDTAPKRLTELLRTLSASDLRPDAFQAVWELLNAAFPQEHVPAPPFTDLTPDQRQAVLLMRRLVAGIVDEGQIQAIRGLLSRHGLPNNAAELDSWSTGAV